VSDSPAILLSDAGERASKSWWNSTSRQWTTLLEDREEQVFLVLTLLIGALAGLAIVAFILVTERFAASFTLPTERPGEDSLFQ